MFNVSLLKHWQNWALVAFVLILVSIIVVNAKKTEVKEN